MQNQGEQELQDAVAKMMKDAGIGLSPGTDIKVCMRGGAEARTPTGRFFMHVDDWEPACASFRDTGHRSDRYRGTAM